jgi:ankyrin repeat protein
MNAGKNSLIPAPQRWERPLDILPGRWKQQLATKYLRVAARGDLKALRQLLVVHPDFLNKRGNHGRTLLWEAARRGKLDAVKWLVEQGAELDATGCYNSESHVQITPFCAAIYYKRANIASYLHSQNPQLDIFRAAFLGDQLRVADQLTAEPDLLYAEDPFDSIYFMPLLAFPVAGGHAAVVDFLFQRGAAVGPYSAGLLRLAAMASRMDLLKLLVTHGADARVVDSSIFVATSDLSILQHLLRHGASATQPGKSGFPPLIYVARGDKAESPEKVQMLIEHGASINAIGPKGRTALHYASAAGHLHVITLLLDHGANPSIRDLRGDTALSLARAAGKTAAVALLMQAVADE